MVYREMLTDIISELSDKKALLELELSKAPLGSLNIDGRRGHLYFTHYIPKGGNRKKASRKSISEDTGMIRALFRKRYLERAIRLIDKDIAVLEKALAQYKEVDEASVMREELERFPELADCLYPGGQSDEEWADDFARATDFYTEDLKSTSSTGVEMRSSGELIIASRLEHFGVPYRYEAKVNHPDVDRRPDFTIRRPRDGKIIYWEHIGMTGDEEYMSGNELKFVEYENNGIVPWDNLIITYNKADGGIDVKIIDAMIQGWLL